MFMFSLYFITGNYRINVRMLYFNGIYVGFSFLIVAMVLYLNMNRRLKKVYIFSLMLGILTIIYNTGELNRLFYADYRTYLTDEYLAYDINKEISKVTGNLTTTKLYFIGVPRQLENLDGYSGHFRRDKGLFISNIDTSVYYTDRIFRFSGEYEYTRIVSFINKVVGTGYREGRELSHEQLSVIAGEMPSYPEDGYVRSLGDSVFVKLGDAILQK